PLRCRTLCPYTTLFRSIGILLYGMVQNGTIDSAILSQYEGEYALPVMAMEVLPSFVIGILFAALISATMSSASSDLMAAASLFSDRKSTRLNSSHASVS